jgi:predicted RNase H-like HicB family nuclease
MSRAFIEQPNGGKRGGAEHASHREHCPMSFPAGESSTTLDVGRNPAQGGGGNAGYRLPWGATEVASAGVPASRAASESFRERPVRHQQTSADAPGAPARPLPLRHETRIVAEVPELPGCAAHGASQEEALTNAKTAARLWIDTAMEFGDPVPEPERRRLSQVGAGASKPTPQRIVDLQRRAKPSAPRA